MNTVIQHAARARRIVERKLFGTDGIRGVAGAFPLEPDTTFAIGRALGRHLTRKPSQPRVVIGQDTRESSAGIAGWLASGLGAAGVEVRSAGVITTPGIAFLARAHGFHAGVVISASHNPWTDNGIKIFGGDGYKLPDEVELEIEHEIFSLLADSSRAVTPAAQPVASLPEDAALRRTYLDWLRANCEAERFRGIKIVVDCANGAASELAVELFRGCGLEARFTHNHPDGRNINEHCGALHPEVLAKAVAKAGSDLGVTFDGDADRSLFASARGEVVNGDAVLLLVARDMQARGLLRNNAVVATTMSNMGLEAALKRSGIRMLRAPVGDKYVLEQMQREQATLGGEQSGHIIFRDGEATTGDGLLTALRVLDIITRSGRPLADLVGDLKVFPQVIKNVRVREKKPLMEIPSIAQATRSAERELDGNGRVVVRYSGTEALARVMIEAESEPTMHRIADAIVHAIQQALGV
jgi:phosphoglucosamine mutase